MAASAAAVALPDAAALQGLQALPGWDFGCAVAAAVGAYAWVKIFDGFARSGLLDRKLTRKLVHATAGPLFLLSWPLFSSRPEARIIAALVPCINIARLTLAGSGTVDDQALVKSTSRSGDRGELLRGPLYYVLILAAATLVFWRGNPAGLVAVSMMCGGDGLADIVGRRWGAGNPLPWNGGKSAAGSAAMLLGGAAMSLGFIYLYTALGHLPRYEASTLVPAVLTVCAAGTVVESLPINTAVDDNLSVPLVSMALTLLLLPA